MRTFLAFHALNASLNTVLALICICNVLAGCGSDRAPASPLAANLRTYPEVTEVTVQRALAPKKMTLVHLLNWHYVSPDAFRSDLRTFDPKLTDAEIDAEYAQFLNEVEAVQQEQMAILRRLIKDYGLRYIYLEGLMDENRDQFLASIEQMRVFERNPPEGETGIELFLLDEHRHQTLMVGAVGRMLLAGDPIEVLACEDAETYAAATPIVSGTVRLDLSEQAKREAAMTKRITEDGHELAVLVRGANHNFDDVRQQFRLH